MRPYSFLCAFVFLFGIVLFSSKAADALEQNTNMLTLGMETGYFQHKDDSMKETGFLSGMNSSFTHHGNFINERFPQGMFKLDGRIIFGRIKYDGVLFDRNHYEIKNVKDFSGEIRGVAGYDFSIFSDTTLTPFTGLGYRYFSDDLSKDNAGYRRRSNYLYSPIGFETNTPLSKGWSAGIAAEYDIFWRGWQDTFLSDLDPLFSDLTNVQKKGYGFKASIKVRKSMEDKNFIFEPYVDYWNIGNSDTQTVYYAGAPTSPPTSPSFQEPKNNSTIFGMRVAVEF